MGRIERSPRLRRPAATRSPSAAMCGAPSEVTAMVDEVVARSGRLDVLVNNAGVQTWTPLLDVTEEEWDLVIATNLKGCFLCTQAAARHMKDARRWRDRQPRIRLQQGRLPAAGRLHGEQGRDRDAHQGGGGRARPARDSGQLRGARRHRHRAHARRGSQLRRNLGPDCAAAAGRRARGRGRRRWCSWPATRRRSSAGRPSGSTARCFPQPPWGYGQPG